MTDPYASYDRRLLTVTEVAHALRVSKMSVYRLCDSGELDCLRVGRNVRIPAAAFRTYVAGGGSPKGYTVLP